MIYLLCILDIITSLFNRSAHSAGPNRGVGPWAVLWLCGIPSGGPGRPRGVPGGRWGGPWGALGVPRGVPGRPWGVSGGPWGGPREAPGGPWGAPGRLRKHVKFSEGVGGGSRGAPGVILVVWGGPRDRPERWKC